MMFEKSDWISVGVVVYIPGRNPNSTIRYFLVDSIFPSIRVGSRNMCFKCCDFLGTMQCVKRRPVGDLGHGLGGRKLLSRPVLQPALRLYNTRVIVQTPGRKSILAVRSLPFVGPRISIDYRYM